jgi:hypothetical protein
MAKDYDCDWGDVQERSSARVSVRVGTGLGSHYAWADIVWAAAAHSPQGEAGRRAAHGAGSRAGVQQVPDVVVVDLQELALHLGPHTSASIGGAMAAPAQASWPLRSVS